MRVSVNSDGGLTLKEVFSGLALETAEGNMLAVCMRDDTVEMQVVGSGRWFRANMETGEIYEMAICHEEAPKFPGVDIDAVHKAEQAQATKPYLSREKMDAIEAFDSLKAEIQKDREYAWSWHCNVAMHFQDEGGGHEQANRAAARFMQNCFQVHVTNFDQWMSFDWAKAATVNPQLTVDPHCGNGGRLGDR
jgi:hypothetical protein